MLLSLILSLKNNRLVRMLFEVLRRKPPGYWLTTTFLIIYGVFLGEQYNEFISRELRFRVYHLLETMTPRKPIPRITVPVLIADNEYWKGPLAGRAPIRRDYLANLLRAVDRCHPAAIALDFDLRSPAVDGSLQENPEYEGETILFKKAIRDISETTPIILPATLGVGEKSLRVNPSIYDGMPVTENVKIGFIQTTGDSRRVLTLKGLLSRICGWIRVQVASQVYDTRRLLSL